METSKTVIITAIIALAFLEAVALMKGLNGTMFSVAVAIIAGLAGWSAPQLKVK